MLNYEALRANYSLWEFESAVNGSARDNFWDVDIKAQYGATDLLTLFCLVPPFCLFPRCRCRDTQLHSRKKPASRRTREVREEKVLSKLKPNCFSSPIKLKTKLSRFPSSLLFCFLLSQMPLISVKAASGLVFFIFFIYVYCLRLSSCLQAGEGSDLVRIWCKFSKESALLQECTLHFQYIKNVISILPLHDPAEQSLLVFILGLHPFR